MRLNSGRFRFFAFFIAFSLSVTLLPPRGAYAAQTFQIVTEELAPFNYTDKGIVTGLCTEMVREMLKRLDHPDTIKVFPWSRSYNLTLNNDGYILYSTIQTASRKDLFKWVGPLASDKTVLFARKGSGIQIKTLDDAKKVASIGTYKDDFSEGVLKEHGFNNLKSILDDRFNAKKLAAGRIDLWVASELVGMHNAKLEGVESKIQSVFELTSDDFFLAFSKNTPNTEIARWQKALDTMKADGTYNRILKKYAFNSQ